VISEVFLRDDGACVLCGSREDIQFDHIIPHSRGGSSTADNLRILCRVCNGKRGARI
jgi:5-methylcytosine-specific restriction endonuclease McrA